jgi:hypothetical protein
MFSTPDFPFRPSASSVEIREPSCDSVLSGDVDDSAKTPGLVVEVVVDFRAAGLAAEEVLARPARASVSFSREA